MSTVRAYHAQETFIKRMESNIDEYFVYYYSNTVSNRWLALRLEIVNVKNSQMFKKLCSYY